MGTATATANGHDTPLAGLIGRINAGSPALKRSALGMLLVMLVCVALMFVDGREFNGINVWDKPAKFCLSLAVQYATVSFAMSLLPFRQRQSRGIAAAVWAMVAAGWFEVLYIAFRAARAEASHFNDSSISGQVLYAVMGLGAVTLTVSAFFVGLRVWGQRSQGLLAEATGLGLFLGMALGTAAGIYVSAQHGHWVGGELSDAHGLGLISWSTTGGDLRVPHFVGLHAAQGLPLAALSGSRLVVYLTAAAFVAATAFTFGQAVLGIPLFRA